MPKHFQGVEHTDINPPADSESLQGFFFNQACLFYETFFTLLKHS